MKNWKKKEGKADCGSPIPIATSTMQLLHLRLREHFKIGGGKVLRVRDSMFLPSTDGREATPRKSK